MSQVVNAIELALPGITDGPDRRNPPSWIDPVERETEIWLGGILLTHIEVTSEWDDDDSGVGRLIINVFTDAGVIAQGSLKVERETGRGRFTGWKIVRQGTITSLEWKDYRRPYGVLSQVTATFKDLADPVLIPGDIDNSVDANKLTEIFRSFRDSWIDTGLSESAAASD